MSKSFDFICIGLRLIIRFIIGCYTLNFATLLNQPGILFKSQIPNPGMHYRDCFGTWSLEPEILKMRISSRNLKHETWNLGLKTFTEFFAESHICNCFLSCNLRFTDKDFHIPVK